MTEHGVCFLQGPRLRMVQPQVPGLPPVNRGLRLSTMTGQDPLLVVGAAIALIVGWQISRWLWHHGPCRRCGGNGKNWGSNSKRWGYCRRCGGSGARRRFGARRED